MLTKKQYKGSLFNFFLEKGNIYLVYNTLYSKLYRLKKTDYELLKTKEDFSVDFDDEFRSPINSSLLSEHLAVNSDTDEINLMYYLLNKKVYDNTLDLTIIPTEGCNFRCVYCFEPHINGSMDDAVENKILAFLKKNLHNYCRLSINWFGGEPLLQSERVIKIMKEAKKICDFYRIPMSGSMVTNGYFLNVDTFDQLVENGVLLYQITVDGTREKHDRLRPLASGKGTYDVIVNNIDEIHQKSRFNSFRITIRTNVCSSNVNEYEVFLREMIDRIGYDRRFSYYAEMVNDWGGDSVETVKNSILTDRAAFVRYTMELYDALGIINYNFSLNMTEMCSVGKVNGFTIGYDGSIHNCSMVEYGSSHDPNRKIQNVCGYLTDNGTLCYDEEIASKIIGWHKPLEKCSGCCWLPVCLTNTCPLYDLENNRVRCSLDFNSVEFYNSLLWTAFSQKRYVDLTEKKE